VVVVPEVVELEGVVEQFGLVATEYQWFHLEVESLCKTSLCELSAKDRLVLGSIERSSALETS